MVDNDILIYNFVAPDPKYKWCFLYHVVVDLIQHYYLHKMIIVQFLHLIVQKLL